MGTALMSRMDRAVYAWALPYWQKVCAWTYPVAWLLDRRAASILDVGCGRGQPIFYLRHWRPTLVAVGVDRFWPYLRLCSSQRLHNAYIAADIRTLPIRSRSFDVVLASHVIEHMSRPEGEAFIADLERIARYQVILVTPNGYVDHDLEDDNPLQAHLSGWQAADFEQRGYRVKRQGLRYLYGNHGLVHTLPPGWRRRSVWLAGALLEPVLFGTQLLANDCLISTKTLTTDARARV